MGQVGTAFRAFFRALFYADDARRIAAALAGAELPKIDTGAKSQPVTQPKAPPKAEAPRRSDALSLLAALQREARLLDLVQEPLGNYTDEQIGAAARNVLRDSAATIERFFGLKRVVPQNEGDTVEAPDRYDAARFHLTGQVNAPPYRGRLVHAGWEATVVNLPAWTGSKEAALVVAPAEIEIA
jgi:hypothetical protein